jgi:DNA polymerase-3 subunit epsilon
MFHAPYTVVDVETTGLSPTKDRLIELAVLRVENGVLAAEYHTLLDPGVDIPRFITTLTGLSYDHLKSAPAFADIADQVRPLLEDAVLVGHNAAFDFRFLHHALRRCGHRYQPKRLCTLQLSRHLFPGGSHNLTAVARRFGLPYDDRHRALADARLTLDVLHYLRDHIDPRTLDAAVRRVLRHPSAPKHVPQDQLRRLPDSPGIYTFYDDKDTPLYIGKSVHLKKRVADHFRDARDSSKEAKLAELTTRIEVQTTAGELGALLRESAGVKASLPIYNQQLRRTSKLTVARLQADDAGYGRVRVDQVGAIDPDTLGDIVGVYRSRAQAKKHLRGLSKDFQLCDKLLGLESGPGPCFGSQIRLCRGACAGHEPPAAYNARQNAVFDAYRLRAWPFDGPIVYTERNPDTGQMEEHRIDRWCYLGSRVRVKGRKAEAFRAAGTFDVDVYRILYRFLSRPDAAHRIRPLKSAGMKTKSISAAA